MTDRDHAWDLLSEITLILNSSFENAKSRIDNLRVLVAKNQNRPPLGGADGSLCPKEWETLRDTLNQFDHTKDVIRRARRASLVFRISPNPPYKELSGTLLLGTVMAQFHETGHGRTFFTYQLPRLISAITRVGDELKRVNDRQETPSASTEQIEAARDQYAQDGFVGIDDNAKLSVTDDCAWVQAWVRIDKE